jgi:nitrilase
MKGNQMSRVKVAAAHVAPVFLDLQKTIDKVCSVIHQAAGNGANLIAFPETFVPAFPVWSALRSPIYNHDVFLRLVANSIQVESGEMMRIREAAKDNQLVVSLGFNETSAHSVGTLYNSNVLIDRDGSILNHHRKIVPTFYEKLTWSAGDGAGLRVCETDVGRVGMLICGENTNPLARYTMMAQAEQIHISTYPPIWPTHGPDESRNYDLAHAIRLRAGAHSFEAKAFNVVASGFMDKPMFDELSRLSSDAAAILEASPRSVSMITAPSGTSIADELCDDEGIVYAEIDLTDCVEPKQFHDISGGYNRFDIFELKVNRTRQRPASFTDAAQEQCRSDDFDPRSSQSTDSSPAESPSGLRE